MVRVIERLESTGRDQIRRYASKIKRRVESISRLAYDSEFGSIPDDKVAEIADILRNIYNEIGAVQITYTKEE